MMNVRDVGLAVAVAIAWGLAFVATKLGIESFSPAQLTAARFLIACLPAAFVPRPVGWLLLVAVGSTLFAGQFLLLFWAYKNGMPPGLASVTQQTQVIFTIVLAAVLLGERPTRRQWTGTLVAFAGLALIALASGSAAHGVALALAIGGAVSWSIGNLFLKRLRDVPLYPLIVWSSAVPPVPALILSTLVDAQSWRATLAAASWSSLLAVLYLALVATLLGYVAWGHLLQRYPASTIAPFALLSPCTGFLTSAVVFGETFGAWRYVGMGLIMTGLCIILARRPRSTVVRPAGARRD